MSLKVKKLIAFFMMAAFAFAMFASCNVVNENPQVLKVGNTKYYYSDYAQIFSSELYTYVYGGGEAQYNKDYTTQTSTQRLKAFQDYAYEKLIEQAIRDYIVAENKLEEQLTEEDKNAIAENVKTAIETSASTLEGEVSKDDVKIEQLKKDYTLTEDEQNSIEKTAKDNMEAAITAKITELNDASASDAAESAATSDDATGSDNADAANKADADREDAIAALLKENNVDNIEAYTKLLEEKAEFDLYFNYYKKAKALELFKNKVEDEDKQSFEEYEKDVNKQETKKYLRTTKLNEFLGKDFKLEDGAVQKYYDEQIKKYEDEYAQDTSAFYNLKNNAGEDTIIWVTPKGYYYVKHILLKSEVASSDAASSDGVHAVNVDENLKKEVEAEIAKLANLSEQEKLEGFDKLIEKYGEDPGMKAEPAKTEGYLMGKGNSMVESFANASEELYNNGEGKIGDISAAVESQHGIHYIQLVKILDEGKVELKDIQDKLTEQLTESGKAEIATDKLAELSKNINIKKFESRIRSIGYGYQDTYFSSNK